MRRMGETLWGDSRPSTAVEGLAGCLGPRVSNILTLAFEIFSPLKRESAGSVSVYLTKGSHTPRRDLVE
jgi:hypothetical protein